MAGNHDIGLNLDTIGGGVAPASKLELAKLKAIFDSLDKDQSGGLDEFELKAAMERAGQKTVSSGDLKSMMLEADKDGNGVIDFTEFCLMYGKSIEIEKEEAGIELLDCFKVMDRDNSGYLDREELLQISALASPCTHARNTSCPIT
jgi:Ca2+-binding EF-hand superfamily protein